VSHGSLPIGGSSRHRMADLWEPDDGGPSRPVLREPGGEIPPGYLPNAILKFGQVNFGIINWLS